MTETGMKFLVEMGIVIVVIFGVLVFVIFVLIIRWIFEIGTIVRLLTYTEGHLHALRQLIASEQKQQRGENLVEPEILSMQGPLESGSRCPGCGGAYFTSIGEKLYRCDSCPVKFRVD